MKILLIAVLLTQISCTTLAQNEIILERRGTGKDMIVIIQHTDNVEATINGGKLVIE